MPKATSLRLLSITLPFLTGSLLVAQTQTLIDNDQVRVLKATDKPHVKNPAHGHKLNRVMVYLTDGKQEITPAGGKATTETFKSGEVRFSKAVASHTSETTSDENLLIMEVELKNEGKPGKLQTGPLDPLKVAPKSYHLEFENDQVRVIRVKMPAHSGVPEHEHLLNRVVVNLSDQDTKMTSADGKVTMAKHKAGEASFGVPVTHKEDNQQDVPFEAIMIEIKK